MHHRVIARWLGLYIALIPVTAIAANEAAWMTIRSLDQSTLLAYIDPDSSEPRDVRVRALLTLAEQALNRSIEDAGNYLQRAEALVDADPDAAAIALQVRCQFEHRQSLPSAPQTCGKLTAAEPTTQNVFVHAFYHTTLMYYFYREGDHTRSLAEAERALELGLGIDDPAILASAHNLVGLHFATRLRPRMSLPHFESALANARRLPYTEPMVITQLNLASSYTYLGRAREALDMLREAGTSPIVSLYDTRRLVVQSMIGQARAAIGETEGAQSNLQAIIDEVSDSVLPDGMTFGYTGLGIIQLANKAPEKALESFDEVLKATGQDFESGLGHPRIQLVAVPYAKALRQSGKNEAARELLENIIAEVPRDKPDQLLLDAYRELALVHEATGNLREAKRAADDATSIDAELWDASFQYQVARLNASLETDRRKFELERARERELALRDKADREVTLRRQTWLIGAMIIALVALLFSRRLQKHIADSERAANARLEDEVAARTRELESEMAKRMEVEVERRQLNEKMLEGEKLRAMGQLTAGIAHDFNNLMTVVTLGADQLKGRNQNDTGTTQILDHIINAADTGAKITRGLLAYVRKQPLQPQSVQLDEFLSDALPIWQNTLGERIALTTQFEPCQALVDKGQLTTAVLNLLLNAKEAMADSGAVSITLRTASGHAQIAVRDDGDGMSETIRKRAIDPFFTTKERGEGSGLGLSMVFGFARQSNGDLTIESEPHVGTVVTLSLPLATDSAVSESAKPAPLRQIPSGTRVLAIDDRVQLLKILEPALAQLGVSVTTASTAAEALKSVERDGMPDVLITDIVMPGKLDGLGLAEHLREQNPDLPIILMSGYSKSVDHDCTFLRKPFTVSELETAIEDTLCSRYPAEPVS